DQDVDMKDANFGTKHRPIDLNAGSAEESLEPSTQSEEVKMVEVEEKSQAEPRKPMKLIEHVETFAGSGMRFKASFSRPDYARCTLDALKSMAGRRGVEYDKSSRTKQPIIDALKAGDKKSFDFLELPAEMRNMIYEELLVDDGLVYLGFDRLPVESEKTLRSRKNFSILLACKQIYDEAKGIGAQALPLTVVFQVIARK
ncbi:hypothetical protein LTS18_011304, partial [Coniosporium uncinatum]